MAIDITVPQLGESIVEATVVQWFKKEGDGVTAGEALLELETEKVTLEVNASDSGVLVRIESAAGEDVQIGDLLGVLDESAGAGSKDAGAEAVEAADAGSEAAEAADEAEGPGDDTDRPAPADTGEAADAGGAADTGEAADAGGAGAGELTEAVPDDRITPVARRMADEAGISLSGVEGTGMGGRIRREDVERAVTERKEKAVAEAAGQDADAGASGRPDREAVEPRAGVRETARPTGSAAGPAETPRDDREEIVPMSRRRRTIASRLVEAQQTAAMLTTFNEIDMSTVMTIRRRNREAFEERHGVRLGFMSFFVKAVIGALKDFPELNAEIRGDSIVRKHYYDIGIAVGAEDGLVVPVLRDADRMSFAEIERGIRRYAARAGDGTLSLEDLRGGTFTITNGGVFGSMLSTPILNPPQVGILGLHRIDDRPAAVDGEVVIRPMMYVALSYDHRIIDGREAVQFLGRVKSLIEVPAALLLEV